MKTNKALLLLALSVSSMAVTHAAEAVLKKGTPYSALLSAGPESGDLIGYAFKNESTVGQAILRSCLPGLFCKVEKSTTSAMNGALPPLKSL